ncbi:MAG: phosphatidate cytidylyltransferase [bacterium]
MNNFWARTITGLSMVFILFAALYLNDGLVAGIFFVITVAGLWEFYQLISSESCSPQRYYGTIAGALLYLCIVWIHFVSFTFSRGWINLLPFIFPLPLFFLTFIFEIYRKKSTPLVNVAMTNLGILYIALPFSLLNLMNGPDKVHFLGFPAILTGYFILTWFYDTGAYLYGKQYGKHKLFERISPKKTWEGTIAGAVVALLTALGFSFLVPEVQMADWFAITILVLVFGTLGDLVESLFKRSLNIKDSGTILPGHGGILDRFDTILISAPFVFLYLFLRNAI